MPFVVHELQWLSRESLHFYENVYGGLCENAIVFYIFTITKVFASKNHMTSRRIFNNHMWLAHARCTHLMEYISCSDINVLVPRFNE